MKPSLNRTTIFKLIVHGIELHAAFEKRENHALQIEAIRVMQMEYNQYLPLPTYENLERHKK